MKCLHCGDPLRNQTYGSFCEDCWADARERIGGYDEKDFLKKVSERNASLMVPIYQKGLEAKRAS